MSASAPHGQTRLTALFTKRPQPGRVKTRLSPPLEPAQAAELASSMLADGLERFSASPDFRTALVFAPAQEEAWFREQFTAVPDQRPQRGEGLAERLAGFFEAALAASDTNTVVVVGSDQPLVSAAEITEAHARLEDGADLVLAPDQGGGYVLVGLATPCPWIFTEVEMSTRSMCDATVALALSRGLAVSILEPGLDVDEAADLHLLRTALAERDPADDGFPARTAAVLTALDGVY